LPPSNAAIVQKIKVIHVEKKVGKNENEELFVKFKLGIPPKLGRPKEFGDKKHLVAI
jgi:hypothetical protein